MSASHAPLPGADKQPHWLHAPAGGPSSRTARIRWPAGLVPGGTCKLAPVTNIGESTRKE